MRFITVFLISILFTCILLCQKSLALTRNDIDPYNIESYLNNLKTNYSKISFDRIAALDEKNRPNENTIPTIEQELLNMENNCAGISTSRRIRSVTKRLDEQLDLLVSFDELSKDIENINTEVTTFLNNCLDSTSYENSKNDLSRLFAEFNDGLFRDLETKALVCNVDIATKIESTLKRYKRDSRDFDKAVGFAVQEYNSRLESYNQIQNEIEELSERNKTLGKISEKDISDSNFLGLKLKTSTQERENLEGELFKSYRALSDNTVNSKDDITLTPGSFAISFNNGDNWIISNTDEIIGILKKTNSTQSSIGELKSKHREKEGKQNEINFAFLQNSAKQMQLNAVYELIRRNSSKIDSYQSEVAKVQKNLEPYRQIARERVDQSKVVLIAKNNLDKSKKSCQEAISVEYDKLSKNIEDLNEDFSIEYKRVLEDSSTRNDRRALAGIENQSVSDTSIAYKYIQKQAGLLQQLLLCTEGETKAILKSSVEKSQTQFNGSNNISLSSESNPEGVNSLTSELSKKISNDIGKNKSFGGFMKEIKDVILTKNNISDFADLKISIRNWTQTEFTKDNTYANYTCKNLTWTKVDEKVLEEKEMDKCNTKKTTDIIYNTSDDSTINDQIENNLMNDLPDLQIFGECKKP